MKAVIKIILDTDQAFGKIKASKGRDVQQSKNKQFRQKRGMHFRDSSCHLSKTVCMKLLSSYGDIGPERALLIRIMNDIVAGHEESRRY